MLLPTVIATVAWVAPFAAALTLLEGRAALSSAQIAELLAAAACQTRRSFTVKDFKLWTPVSGNANETTLSFRYTDTGEPAPINTACHLNSTSKSLTAGSGHTPRYACENRRVNFIWQKNSELVPIEEASCSDQSGTIRFESSGIVRPNATWTCSATGCGSRRGGGTCCVATDLQATSQAGIKDCLVRDNENDPLPDCPSRQGGLV